MFLCSNRCSPRPSLQIPKFPFSLANSSPPRKLSRSQGKPSYPIGTPERCTSPNATSVPQTPQDLPPTYVKEGPEPWVPGTQGQTQKAWPRAWLAQAGPSQEGRGRGPEGGAASRGPDWNRPLPLGGDAGGCLNRSGGRGGGREGGRGRQQWLFWTVAPNRLMISYMCQALGHVLGIGLVHSELEAALFLCLQLRFGQVICSKPHSRDMITMETAHSPPQRGQEQ